MGLIRRVKNRIKPGPIRLSGSLSLSGAKAILSFKPPLLRRKTIFKKSMKWR